MATPQDRLNEAQTALHQLRTGTAAVEVRDSDGSSIRYTRASIGDLKAYIAELTAEIAGTCPPDEGPMRVIFL